MPFLEEDLKPDPLAQFVVWFKDAENKMGHEPATAMTLSTLDLQGFPDGRIVLLKQFDARGFVFYTNLHSTKGRSLAGHPKAALTFHWPPLERQVRIQGPTELVSNEEADAYFHSRPRDAQLGAWASNQSTPLENRAQLDQRLIDFTKKFGEAEIPRPPQWTGVRVKPLKIEFWQAGLHRLHDRFLYEKRSNTTWLITRLYP